MKNLVSLNVLIFFLALTAHPPFALGAGLLPIPSLEDERQTYRNWGVTWDSGAEPNLPSWSGSVVDPGIHGDTEGDDLWTNIQMYRRTGQAGYLSRAQAWARYFKDDYMQCVGTTDTMCDIESGHASNPNKSAHAGYDHLYGWGLIDYYYFTNNVAYLNAAIAIADNTVAIRYSGYSVNEAADITYWGSRGPARHLILITRLAEATGDAKWINLRDKMISLWRNATSWDSARGMYWYGSEYTDSNMGNGSYDNGWRIVSAFSTGIVMEALWQAYRTTGDSTIRDRIIAQANFLKNYALDPTYNLVHSFFGVNINTGQRWGSYDDHSAQQNCSEPGGIWWDSVYSTSLVNSMMMGYKLTGDNTYLTKAKTMLVRGANGIYGSNLCRTSGDPTKISHFVDSEFNFTYFARNQGELQYTYMLFENPGSTPPPDSKPPASPKNLRVSSLITSPED